MLICEGHEEDCNALFNLQSKSIFEDGKDNSMSEGISTLNIAAVPDDVHQSLLVDGSDVQTKVGHVAKCDLDEKRNDLEENVVLDEIVHYQKLKENNQFLGLTKEELKCYINNPRWKRIRWIIAIGYLLFLLLLLLGSILLIIYSQRCPPKPKLLWYEKEIIYEIDVTTYRDTNNDGIGDIKGIEEKLSYLEQNNIKSILLRSSIFNVSNGRSIQLDGQKTRENKYDLLTIDPSVGNNQHLQDLFKILYRKDMHLILDLPLSTTSDPSGYSWYGSSNPLSTKINNPCIENELTFACRYYQFYGQLPLDFNDQMIYNQSELRLRYWLSTNKVDGVRVNLPLLYNSTRRSYDISYNTIDKWNQIKLDIEKKTKPKLILIDIPFAFEDIMNKSYFHDKTAYPILLLNNEQRTTIDAQFLDKRLKSLSKPHFWKLGSERRSDRFGILDQNHLSKEMILTLIMLLGGTPIILYGEEIHLDRKTSPLMSWTSEGLFGGFSSCSSSECQSLLSSYQITPSKTSVKLQEALGGESKDSLLRVFRRLSKLRLNESFEFGSLESGYDQQSNIYWFIRESLGHRGYVIVLNLNPSGNAPSHISLHKLTKGNVPFHIHYEYQWPNVYFPTSNERHINSDNLLIHPQSINIFWWIPKLLKGKSSFENGKEHSNDY